VSKNAPQRISRRHALNDKELAFVRIYSAFGGQNAAEAYRRSHLAEDEDGNWYEHDKRGEPRLDRPVDAKAASKRAAALLAQDHISGYLEEMKLGAGDHARQQLADAVLFTDDTTALKAAEKVLADEDKLGFRDAVQKWAEVMVAIGTEVVVPLPDGREAVVPLGSLFPQYATAMPPVDVIEKTIRTLQAFKEQVERGSADAA
jgi:hypothetical protein